MPDSHWAHAFSAAISADPATVFAALTEPAALRQWFADQVRVEPRVGGAWQFWGRHSIGTPPGPHSDDRLLEFTPPRQLRYAWTLEGCPTVVTLTLTGGESGGGPTSTLAVRHELAGPLPHPRPAELVDDFWRLAFGNLMAHLAGGHGLLRPDFGDPHPEVRVAIDIAAPPAEVWRALLDPEALRQWVGATAPVVDPRVGGAYRYGWQYPIGDRQVTGGPRTILELLPERLLVTDWPDWRGDPSMPLQRIEWHLEPAAGGTRVTLVHAGFTRAADISDYPVGWTHFVGALGAHVIGR